MEVRPVGGQVYALNFGTCKFRARWVDDIVGMSDAEKRPWNDWGVGGPHALSQAKNF